MTQRTLKIAALRTPLLLALLTLAQAAHAQSGRTFYIDFSSGSNSNPGTKVSPWKTHPYMQTGSGCTGTGSAPSYAHQAGDHFIFKGGVTWPAACFGMTISNGGSSISTVSGAGASPTINGADYYGVDTTWFAGGSFARPIFDLANTIPAGTNGAVITTRSNYITLDDIEIKRNELTSTTSSVGCSGGSLDLSGSNYIVLDRMYIHDWTMTNLADLQGSHDSGSICGAYDGNGYIKVYNTEMSDAATTATMPFGTCFSTLQRTSEVAYSNCHNVGEGGVFTQGSFHDSQIHDLDGSPASAPSGVHSNGYESDGFPPDFYNNLMYNLNVDFNAICASSKVVVIYNNVTWHSKDAAIALDDLPSRCPYATTSSQSYIYNNTNDATTASDYGGSAHGSIRLVNRTGGNMGTVTMKNNISVNNGFDLGGLPATQATNRTLTSTEATTYGFNAAGKYSPASSDPNTVLQATNLTSSCGTLAALCLDASGAPWFGGSYKTRPTGSTNWDMGAYQFQGGSTGPPSISISSPSTGTVSASVNLTATCTPQGSATVSSIQFTIDGFPFGAAGASSPYTLSWNTATAANANHTIGATCTDSNAQVGTAATVSVTVSNSIPGCFISTDNDSGALSWTANQPFTAQSANFTATVTVTPNTAHQDTVVALSESAMSAYSQGAALLRFNSSGFIDVYKGTISNYTSDNSAPYTPGTAYSFTYTINFTGPNAGTYSVSETSPSSIAIATNYAFRSTALVASLGFINAISDNTTPDTAQVCNFQVGSTASLTFSPLSLNFGNITVGSNATQTITATTSGGSVNFSSVGISGNADFTINSNACSGSVPSSCTTLIKFAPTSAALETATITYTDSATGSPQSVAVSGTGVPATPTLSVDPSSVNFGGVQVLTTSSSGPIVLTISSGPITFTGTPSFSGPNAADFALASNTCTGTVSAASCQTVVSFTPTLVATESATLTYTDSATGSPQTVSLTGSGYLAPHPPTAVHATVN